MPGLCRPLSDGMAGPVDGATVEKSHFPAQPKGRRSLRAVVTEGSRLHPRLRLEGHLAVGQTRAVAGLAETAAKLPAGRSGCHGP